MALEIRLVDQEAWLPTTAFCYSGVRTASCSPAVFDQHVWTAEHMKLAIADYTKLAWLAFLCGTAKLTAGESSL